MLQYITKHLKEGDHIYVETLSDTIAGQIEQVNADRLVLKKGTETITLLENDMLGITSLKPPYRCKEVDWFAFREFPKLQSVYIPLTISDIGDRMIGGKSDCKLYDFNGNLLDHEEYVEVEFKDSRGMSFEDFLRHRHFGRKDKICGGGF